MSHLEFARIFLETTLIGETHGTSVGSGRADIKAFMVDHDPCKRCQRVERRNETAADPATGSR